MEDKIILFGDRAGNHPIVQELTEEEKWAKNQREELLKDQKWLKERPQRIKDFEEYRKKMERQIEDREKRERAESGHVDPVSPLFTFTSDDQAKDKVEMDNMDVSQFKTANDKPCLYSAESLAKGKGLLKSVDEELQAEYLAKERLDADVKQQGISSGASHVRKFIKVTPKFPAKKSALANTESSSDINMGIEEPQMAINFVNQLDVGSNAPAWAAIGINKGVKRTEFSSQMFDGQYYVVLFYNYDRLHLFCPAEVLQLSERMNEFQDIQCSIVGISDIPLNHVDWITTSSENDGYGRAPAITLVYDKSESIAKSFGITYFDETTHGYKSSRGYFIMDKSQKIRSIYKTNYYLELNVDEMIKRVIALQNADENLEMEIAFNATLAALTDDEEGEGAKTEDFGNKIGTKMETNN